jgi:hypothetical protein
VRCPEHLEQSFSDSLSCHILFVCLCLLDLVKELNHSINLTISKARVLFFEDLLLKFYEIFNLLEHRQSETLIQIDRVEEKKRATEVSASLHQVISRKMVVGKGTLVHTTERTLHGVDR